MSKAESNGQLDFTSFIHDVAATNMNTLTVQIGLQAIKDNLTRLVDRMKSQNVTNRELIKDAIHARMAVICSEGIVPASAE